MLIWDPECKFVFYGLDNQMTKNGRIMGYNDDQNTKILSVEHLTDSLYDLCQ